MEPDGLFGWVPRSRLLLRSTRLVQTQNVVEKRPDNVGWSVSRANLRPFTPAGLNLCVFHSLSLRRDNCGLGLDTVAFIRDNQPQGQRRPIAGTKNKATLIRSGPLFLLTNSGEHVMHRDFPLNITNASLVSGLWCCWIYCWELRCGLSSFGHGHSKKTVCPIKRVTFLQWSRRTLRDTAILARRSPGSMSTRNCL